MKHPPPSTQKGQPLSMPVIIPERRPGFKTRGFVRAYAPVLEEAGIDQDTFIEVDYLCMEAFLGTSAKTRIVSGRLREIDWQTQVLYVPLHGQQW